MKEGPIDKIDVVLEKLYNFILTVVSIDIFQRIDSNDKRNLH